MSAVQRLTTRLNESASKYLADTFNSIALAASDGLEYILSAESFATRLPTTSLLAVQKLDVSGFTFQGYIFGAKLPDHTSDPSCKVVYIPHVIEQLEAFHMAVQLIFNGPERFEFPTMPEQVVRLVAELLYLGAADYLAHVFRFVFCCDSISDLCPELSISNLVRRMLQYLQNPDAAWWGILHIIKALSLSLDCTYFCFHDLTLTVIPEQLQLELVRVLFSVVKNMQTNPEIAMAFVGLLLSLSLECMEQFSACGNEDSRWRCFRDGDAAG